MKARRGGGEKSPISNAFGTLTSELHSDVTVNNNSKESNHQRGVIVQKALQISEHSDALACVNDVRQTLHHWQQKWNMNHSTCQEIPKKISQIFGPTVIYRAICLKSWTQESCQSTEHWDTKSWWCLISVKMKTAKRSDVNNTVMTQRCLSADYSSPVSGSEENSSQSSVLLTFAVTVETADLSEAIEFQRRGVSHCCVLLLFFHVRQDMNHVHFSVPFDPSLMGPFNTSFPLHEHLCFLAFAVTLRALICEHHG